MKVTYAAIYVGVIFISLAILFMLPAETTGFATNIEPTPRRIWGSLFATAGAGSVAVGVFKGREGDRGRKRGKGGKDPGSLTNSITYEFDDLKERIMEDVDLTPGERIEFRDNQRRKGIDAYDIIGKLADIYDVSSEKVRGITEYVKDRMLRYRGANEYGIEAGSVIGLILHGFYKYLHGVPESARGRARGKRWQI